jgi:hypothetical protein
LQRRKMEGDAKYLKRKVKAGSLDVHPTEKALGEASKLILTYDSNSNSWAPNGLIRD